MEKQMIEKINALIERANEIFKETGWDHSHELRLARIDGMVEMMTMITGKDYVVTESGIKEKQENTRGE